jgi:hypothetical protein
VDTRIRTALRSTGRLVAPLFMVLRRGGRWPTSSSSMSRRRVAARECDASAGVDSAIDSVRIEKETEFVSAHRAVVDRHRERQRNQVLPPE